ncbi:hypothetical protein SGFS_066030 [Streptomyces graminofaciens]|uniref:Zinc-finger domain-containing protein n=1 Tax=Streptomyces graminofaciens TaxID=68212 RepID=A0ABM7FE25_9ACTN|nr:hypothetical protein [Streptomyces graminofaciens]BBC35309.1 hypothetical protein SGFS_066030 [Streptomyces graminofaciens]
MTSTERIAMARAHSGPLRFPDHLPGEAEYGEFMTHLLGCADCGYGQVQCETATGLWQAYKAARPKRI